MMHESSFCRPQSVWQRWDQYFMKSCKSGAAVELQAGEELPEINEEPRFSAQPRLKHVNRRETAED